MWIREEYKVISTTLDWFNQRKDSIDEITAYKEWLSRDTDVLNILQLESIQLFQMSFKILQEKIEKKKKSIENNWYNTLLITDEMLDKRYLSATLQQRMHAILPSEIEEFSAWKDKVSIVQMAFWNKNHFRMINDNEIENVNNLWNKNQIKNWKRMLQNKVIKHDILLDPERIPISIWHYLGMAKNFPTTKKMVQSASPELITENTKILQDVLSRTNLHHKVNFKQEYYWPAVQKSVTNFLFWNIFHYSNPWNRVDKNWFPEYTMDIYEDIYDYLDRNKTS